jgi:hypothetical protein
MSAFSQVFQKMQAHGAFLLRDVEGKKLFAAASVASSSECYTTAQIVIYIKTYLIGVTSVEDLTTESSTFS